MDTLSIADAIRALSQTLMGGLTVAVAMMGVSVTFIAVVIAIMHWRFSETALKKEIEEATEKISAQLDDRIGPLEGRILMDMGEYFGFTRPETEPRGRRLSIDYRIMALSKYRWHRPLDKDLIRQLLNALSLAVPGIGNILSIEDLKRMRDAFETAVQHIGVVDDESVQEDIYHVRRHLGEAVRQSIQENAK